MTKNILLTGGFGTLGGRLSAVLAQDKDCSLRLASRSKRLAPSWAPNADSCEVDFEDKKSIKQMLSKITHVVHLVAMTDFESKAQPDMAKHVNTEYMRRVLEQSPKGTRFIYLSTIQVYGKNIKGAVSEKTNPDPSDAYSQTHLDSENIIKAAHLSEDVQGLSLRNANGFGAPMSPDAKIWQIIANDLCRQAIEKKHLTLNSHGLQFRNFIPFNDVVVAVRHCLNMNSELIGDGTFNLGGEKSLKVREMAELIISRCNPVLGFRPELNILGAPPDIAPEQFSYNCSKLEATGFKVSTRLTDEIDKLLLACQKWFGK